MAVWKSVFTRSGMSQISPGRGLAPSGVGGPPGGFRDTAELAQAADTAAGRSIGWGRTSFGPNLDQVDLSVFDTDLADQGIDLCRLKSTCESFGYEGEPRILILNKSAKFPIASTSGERTNRPQNSTVGELPRSRTGSHNWRAVRDMIAVI